MNKAKDFKINILIPIIKKLYGILNKKHKIHLVILVFLTFGLSIIETVGISIIMPFISVASNPQLLDGGTYKKIFDLFNFVEKSKFIIYFGIVIVVFYFFKSLYNIGHVYLLNRYSQSIYRNFVKGLFNSFLFMPYKNFVQKNSGEMMQITYGTSREACSLLLNILQLGSEFITVLLIYSVIVIINWKMTIILTGVLAIIFVLFLYVLITKSKEQGAKQIAAGMNLYRIMVKTFGNFKFIRLKGNEKSILTNTDSLLEINSRANIIHGTLGVMPKTILESIGFSILVIAIIAIIAIYNDASGVIPVISMYALALYRILPSINKILNHLNIIAFYQKSLDLVAENIDQATENEGAVPVNFNKSISLQNVSFKYLTGDNILNSVFLEIAKGEKIAIIGESGCGKSTLADLIIGIIKPVSGSLYIDDTLITDENIRDWRKKIGYIPQNIYLFDDTVAENVVIGSEYNEEKLINVLKMANIWDFLSTKEGIHTKVGEKGIQLSGGQQQRIGIARALYDDPEVLILDEATSALDTETEQKIMDEIYSVSKNKTLIVIAHRLSTVERCERKIRIENGTPLGQ